MTELFRVGDKVKFSETGLNRWLEGRRGFFDDRRYREWRWEVTGFSTVTDRDGKPFLILKRCDIKPYVREECWSQIFFEVIRDERPNPVGGNHESIHI